MRNLASPVSYYGTNLTGRRRQNSYALKARNGFAAEPYIHRWMPWAMCFKASRQNSSRTIQAEPLRLVSVWWQDTTFVL